MIEKTKEREIIRARKNRRHTYSNAEIRAIFESIAKTLEECSRELEP